MRYSDSAIFAIVLSHFLISLYRVAVTQHSVIYQSFL
jgi:hypothetical protein